ncbi:MAG: hypothetical protein QM638_03490 [Nocardioides sp.]|uniref:hypothetical protein n=1 Tax=Nocardioides sp. TaxID=35761 RepID=UPI0039E24AAC
MTAEAIMAKDGAPNAALLWTDYARGLAEFGSLPVAWPALTRAPRGDGHPVLVLPGLGAGDLSTLVLRRLLRRLGYRTYAWRLGTNLGPTARVVEGMPARLDAIHRAHERPVSLIGWSLGGIFARRLARQAPDAVRQVITLGSPIRLRRHEDSNARLFYQLTRRGHVEDLPLPLEEGLDPLPVPATSIYSRLDGIVSWRSCLDESSARAENIEVRAAHFGFGYHAAVLYAVADRLAQPAGQWAPFRPPSWLRPAYPRPATGGEVGQ